ncbi:MAG: hypothetical protein K8L99_26860 [Anaerolineae bacterium]|nr:hypothetical protein [Anaerolineae bacterium]
MSLLELILDQQLIVITLGAAAGLLLIAVLAIVGMRVRALVMRLRAKKSKKKAIEKARRQRAIAHRAAANEEVVETAAANKQGEAGSAEADEEDEDEDEEEEPAIPPGMQDILSNVFADDQAASRYEALLKGTEPIDMDELAAFTQQIAARLTGEAQ